MIYKLLLLIKAPYKIIIKDNNGIFLAAKRKVSKVEIPQYYKLY